MKIASCALDGRTGHEAGRALLAALYREETGLDLPPVAIAAGGKPYFPGSDWHFSISHTPRHAFCALSRREIGIDAEEYSPWRRKSCPPGKGYSSMPRRTSVGRC